MIMKIVFLSMAALSSVPVTFATTPLPLPGRSNNNLSPQEILESPECESFVMEIEMKMSEFLEVVYDDDDDDVDVTSGICNPIEREHLVEVIGKMEKHINNKKNPPCLQAYEMLILEQKFDVMESLISDEACNNEIRNELVTLQYNGDGGRGRALLRGGGGRKLFFWIIPVVTISVAVFVIYADSEGWSW